MEIKDHIAFWRGVDLSLSLEGFLPSRPVKNRMRTRRRALVSSVR